MLLTDIHVHSLWIMYRYIQYIECEPTKQSAHTVHLVDGSELSGMLHNLPQQLGFCSVVFADVYRILIYKSMTTVQLYCP